MRQNDIIDKGYHLQDQIIIDVIPVDDQTLCHLFAGALKKEMNSDYVSFVIIT